MFSPRNYDTHICLTHKRFILNIRKIGFFYDLKIIFKLILRTLQNQYAYFRMKVLKQ